MAWSERIVPIRGNAFYSIGMRSGTRLRFARRQHHDRVARPQADSQNASVAPTEPARVVEAPPTSAPRSPRRVQSVKSRASLPQSRHALRVHALGIALSIDDFGTGLR